MNKQKSFTLIELLVVIVIIGILAGVIIVSISSSINKANFAKAQSFSNTVQNELLGDLVSEWTFNSPAVSGKTEDSWGNNDGTLVGANGLPQLQTKENCVYGTCYSFDGVDDYIDCGNNYNYERSDNVAISAWIKSNGNQDSGFGGIVCNIFGFYSKNRILLTDSNEIYAQFLINNIQSNFISTKQINTGEWNHIVYTYDGIKEKIYINSEVIEKVNSGDIKTGTSPVLIGYGEPSGVRYHFNGLIDDVRIYNAALSSAQIKKQYVAGLDSLYSKGIISESEFVDRISGK